MSERKGYQFKMMLPAKQLANYQQLAQKVSTTIATIIKEEDLEFWETCLVMQIAQAGIHVALAENHLPVPPSAETQAKDAQRYRYLISRWAKRDDLETDGKAHWYINTPYLGQRIQTFDEALDAAMDEEAPHA